MKATRFLAPVLALAAAAVWLGWQGRQIGHWSAANEVLREKIEKARSRPATMAQDAPGHRTDRGATGGREGVAKSWREIAARMEAAQTRSGPQALRESLWLQQRALAMSSADLMAALDEVAGLEMPDDVRRMIEDALIGAMANKDPALLLESFRGWFGKVDGMRAWQLGDAFGKWLTKDPKAAEEWFDTCLAAGELTSKSLDGKNPLRTRMEAAMLARTVATDPEAARLRIEAVPPDQRRDVFQTAWGNLEPGSEKAFASLARGQVPEKDFRAMLNDGTNLMFHQGGLEKVSQFLDQIDAPAAEREQAAGRAAQEQIKRLGNDNQINPGEVAGLRKWLATQVPERVDTLTGQALAAVPANGYGQAVEVLTGLHNETGSDEMLVSFLHSASSSAHQPEALAIANRIKDATLREEALARLRPPSPP